MNIYRHILQRVTGRQIKTVTFDIFDTLIFRHVSDPLQVFSLIDSSIFAGHGVPAPDYPSLRVHAEALARQRHNGREDIQFEQIFSAMPFSPALRSALALAECEAETQISVVNTALVDVIRQLKEQGVQVALISDMYFSAAQIREIFFRGNEDLCQLPLFVSSETGVTKQSGKLFLHVKEVLKASPESWLHAGDNKASDVEAALAAGLDALHFSPAIDVHFITRMEMALSPEPGVSGAARTLSCLEQPAHSEKGGAEYIARDLGSFVWGPVMQAFAGWLRAQCEAANIRHILCVMREGAFFTPLLRKYFALQGEDWITVESLYVSRLSAFWAGINTEKADWLEQAVDTLIHYNGYTLQNFVDDFYLSSEGFGSLSPTVCLRSAGNMMVDGRALRQVLLEKAHKNSARIQQKVATQKSLFLRYTRDVLRADFGDCAVVDFGDGGTIQHSLESIFGSPAKANFLFFATNRIYRFLNQTTYSVFLPPGGLYDRIAERLARSPECIEALLLGSEGSTLSYVDDDGEVRPVTGRALPENSAFCDAFLEGCLTYMDMAHKMELPGLPASQAALLVKRYLMMPCEDEATLFAQLKHQDNFGSDNEFYVIDEEQKTKLKADSARQQAVAQVTSGGAWQKGELHWPAGVLATEDKNIVPRFMGLLKNDKQQAINFLINRMASLGWRNIGVYGAGEFFVALAPSLRAAGIAVSHLIDRKAGLGKHYQVAGYTVVSVGAALEQGCRRIVIASQAFQQEIKDTIMLEAQKQECCGIDIIAPDDEQLKINPDR